MMWLRQRALDVLAHLIDYFWENESRRVWLQYHHGRVLAAQMAARRKNGQQEIRTGIYDMTEEELNDHARKF